MTQRSARSNQTNFVRLRMLKRYRGLNPGEIGGFQPGEGRSLLQNGTAQALNVPYPPAASDETQFPLPPPQAGDPSPETTEQPLDPEEPEVTTENDDQPAGGDRMRGPGRRARSG